MQTFLRQLQMRVTLGSVIWLHDGVWIPNEVSASDIQFAERATLQALSLSVEDEQLFQVRRLDALAERALAELRIAPRRAAPFQGRITAAPVLTRDYPPALVQAARVSHANDDEYLGRMSKRQRYS